MRSLAEYTVQQYNYVYHVMHVRINDIRKGYYMQLEYGYIYWIYEDYVRIQFSNNITMYFTNFEIRIFRHGEVEIRLESSCENVFTCTAMFDDWKN